MEIKEPKDVIFEKYRPQRIDEVILPEDLKVRMKGYLEQGGYKLPHLGLFSKNPGTGKSTLAKVILNELECEALWINASLDKGIDVLRSRIQRFSANRPLKDCVKVVVMDEFDHFTKDGQAAFRGFIDQFGQNVRFIFTGNYKENIIEPLLDRLEVYDFNAFDFKDVAVPIFNRLKFILDSEGISYNVEDVKTILKTEYPRIRKMIGLLGSNIKGNELVLSSYNKEDLKVLIENFKAKDYSKVITYCYTLNSVDHLYSLITENLSEFLEPSKHINAIILLAKYNDMALRAKDKHLNLCALLAELMKL